MKRSKMLCLVTVCTFVVASTIFANSLMAQTDVRYRIHWITGPADTTVWQLNDLVVTTDENGEPTTALVVGSYYRENLPISGFVYDVLGTIDPDLTRADPNPGIPNDPIRNRFWDVEELAAAPEGWSWVTTAKSSLRGANSAGLIAGYVEDADGLEQAVYLNLDLGNPDAAPYKLVLLPRPDGDVGNCRGRDVTEWGDVTELGGDILVNYQSTLDGDWRGYVYNAYTASGPEDIASAGEPIVFSSEAMYLNKLRQVVGKRADGMVIRYSMPNGTYEEFSGLYSYGQINDWGQFAATANNIRGRHRYATRVGPDRTIEWTAAERNTYAYRINVEGDLLFNDSWSGGEQFYYHEGLGESFNLKDLIIAGSDPDFWFRDQDDGSIRVSDRDFTGFGWVAKALRVTNPDGSTTWKLALLIPESPTPGISVTPTHGLVTTEGGGTDTFEVKLDTAPAADVTIDISSSNTGEGTVDPTSLTFATSNWDIPQTATVTGVDDDLDDGDVVYEVEVTPSSIDPDYDNLDPIIVEVTNWDDDGPTGGGSETYFSNDTPVQIPDYPRDGVASSILVEDNLLITDLTVNVDIMHRRPLDLKIWLVGPDDTRVELFPGDNLVADFNDTSSLGLWTLEVDDLVENKKGKLNSWSITIDY